MKTLFEILEKQVLIVIFSILSISCIDKEDPYAQAFSELNSIELVGLKAKLKALILDSGSDRIIEYGFLIAKNQDPASIPYNAIKVSMEGKIEGSFTLSTDLPEPGYYLARAYLKTALTTYYSPEVEFLYDGLSISTSKEISIPEEIYFGDIITINYSSFGMSESEYYAEINGTPAKIIQIENDSFKLIIPDSIDFSLNEEFEKYNIEINSGIILKISYQTSDGLISKVKKVTFSEPYIDYFILSDPDFPLEKNWFFEGKRLKDINLKLRIDGSNDYLKIVNATDELIEVESVEGLDFENPMFILTCRGKEYEINDFNLW